MEPRLLRYSWQDAAGCEITEVTYRLDACTGGTRFTYDHTGFTGIGGFFMAQLLGYVRGKMLRVGLPQVLADLAAAGRAGAASQSVQNDMTQINAASTVWVAPGPS
jgi:hypothetical protein